MAISSALELKSSLINSAGSDSTSSQQARWVGGGGGQLFEGGDYFKYFRLRDTIIINRGTAIIRGNMVVWVACTIKGRGKKVQKGKGRGSSCHKNLCFCMLPTRFPNVNCHYLPEHFSLFRVSRCKQCEAKLHQNQNIIPLKMAKIEFLRTKTVIMLWAWRSILMAMSGKLLAALVNFKVTSVFSSSYFSEVFILTLREMTNSYNNYLHDNMKGWNMECLTVHIVDWDQKLLIEWKDFFQRVFAKNDFVLVTVHAHDNTLVNALLPVSKWKHFFVNN